MSDVDCRVCRESPVRPFLEIDNRCYQRCLNCEAVLLAAVQLPDPLAERQHYAHHRNDVHDRRFSRFLARLVDPLAARLAPGSTGLDYGCGPGPGPAAAAMLREMGHDVVEYDPFFRPAASALEGNYDFIICSEVIEHFDAPGAEFEQLRFP